jgi:hypothetical protein
VAHKRPTAAWTTAKGFHPVFSTRHHRSSKNIARPVCPKTDGQEGPSCIRNVKNISVAGCLIVCPPKNCNTVLFFQFPPKLEPMTSFPSTDLSFQPEFPRLPSNDFRMEYILQERNQYENWLLFTTGMRMRGCGQWEQTRRMRGNLERRLPMTSRLLYIGTKDGRSEFRPTMRREGELFRSLRCNTVWRTRNMARTIGIRSR